MHHLHAILSTALTKAEKWGWVERAPTRGVSPPPLRSKEITAPTPEQLNILIAEASDPVLAVAIALAALTGCRRGELAALRWSDVDLTIGRVHVWRSLSVVKGELDKGPTKTHAIRKVPSTRSGSPSSGTTGSGCRICRTPPNHRSPPTLTCCPAGPTVPTPLEEAEKDPRGPPGTRSGSTTSGTSR